MNKISLCARIMKFSGEFILKFLIAISVIFTLFVVTVVILAYRDKSDERRGLHDAAGWNGSVREMKQLLSRGADINIRDKNNATPIFEAVKSNQLEHVKFLVNEGADFRLKDSFGRNLLYYTQDMEIIEYLLGLGLETPDVTAEIYLGSTFADHGFSKESLNVDSQQWHNRGTFLTEWRYAGYLCQVGASLRALSDGRFEIVLRMENIGNNPYYVVSPVRAKEYLQIMMTDGLQSFSPKPENVIGIFPDIDPDAILPDYKLHNEKMLEIPKDSYIRLIPKYDSKADFDTRLEKEIGAELTKIDYDAEQGAAKRVPCRSAVLTISHPEFRIEKIREWENLLVILWLKPQFLDPPFVAPEGGFAHRKLTFCLPNFQKDSEVQKMRKLEKRD